MNSVLRPRKAHMRYDTAAKTICVGVTRREIEQAQECGGRLRFELKDCTAVMDKLPCYRLGRADRLG
jgi:hypothetical protein